MSAGPRSNAGARRRALLDAARAWMEDDPDPSTQAELAALVAVVEGGDREAEADLAERFADRLQFGTAGLRGPLGAGPNRMNRALVRRAAAGLAGWLRSTGADAAERGVAVGFDARHRSADFAHDTAAVLAGAGVTVHLLAGPLPTPVLAFAVRDLGCVAGVMVTASHNPATDNGYKVYDATGAQIVSPADREISAAVDAVGPVPTIRLAPLDSPLVHRCGPELVDRYLEAVAGLVPGSTGGRSRGPKIVYTPMHGVGAAVAVAALERAGFDRSHVVAAQAAPDPDFPTLAFPNPEEPGALDLALAEARSIDADLVLATDPDADRLGVAVPDATAAGGWRVLSGDEIGVLLAWRVLGGLAPSARTGAVVATTIVSSTLLAKLAAADGVGHVETLTGFKWIVRAVDDEPGLRLVFGYEEALGSCVAPDRVRDKDGVAAMVVFTDLAAALRAEQRTVLDVLDDLARRFGVHATGQWSRRIEGLDGVVQREVLMTRLRADPPSGLAGRVVVGVVDLLRPGGPLPVSDVLTLRLDQARVVVRPSGTEPKLKAYLEVVVPVTGDLAAARTAAATELVALSGAVADLLG